jgi:acyl-CoA thioesterase-1
MDRDHTERFHGAYAELARSRSIALIPDFLPGVPGDPELTLPDGLHPNERGVERIVQTVLPAIRPLMDASRNQA